MFLLSLMIASFAQGTILPGRWERVDSLVSGTEIVIVMRSGARINANFSKSNGDALVVVQQPQGNELTILKSDVRRVERQNVDDSIRNGVLIGMAAGFGVLLLHGSDNVRASYAAGYSLIVGVPVGAVLGYIFDKKHKVTVVLFTAPN
jgi:hypothetical protein